MCAAITARGALVAAIALLAIVPAANAGQAGGHDEPDVFKEKKTCGKLGLPFTGRIGPARTGSYSFGDVKLRFDQRTRLKAQWSVSGGALSAIIVRGGSLNAVHDVTGKGSGWIEQPYKGKGHGWGHSEVVICGGPKPPPHPGPEPAKGKLIVKKITDPSGAQQPFGFTVTGAQAAPGLPASFSLSGGQSKELAGLPGGPYTVSEGAVAGWKLVSIKCELDYGKDPLDPWKPGHGGWGKPKPGHGHSGHKRKPGKPSRRAHRSTGGGYFPPVWPAPSYDLPSGTATVTVPAGKTVVCTFKNEQPPSPPPGKLIVKKITDPADTQASFEFTVSSSQTVAGLPSSFALGHGGSKELAGLPGGKYTITEQSPQGWRLGSVTCKIAYAHAGKARTAGRRGGRPRGGGHGGSWNPPPVYDVDSGSAQVELPAGKTVVCTFKNVPGPAPGSGRIIVQKLTYPAGSSESFSFTVGGVPEGFELQDGGLRQVHGLAPGSYTITEAPKQGWQLSSVNCWAIDAPAAAPSYDLAAGRATVQVVAGGTVICAFLNSQAPAPPPAETGTIIVSKLAAGATSEAFGFTTGAIAPAAPLSPPTFTLGNAQSRTFGGVPVGIYTVTEDSFSGWTLQQAACSDIGGSAGGPSTSVTGATATINLAAGDVVWCVYTNARAAVPPPGIVTPPTVTPPTGGTGEENKTGTTGRSTARISAPRRCVRGRYSIRVRGKQVSSIAVSLNGRQVKTVRGRSGTATYTVTMPVSKARVQRVSAVVRFRPGVAPSRRTLRATMVRCRARGVPKFTG